MRNSNFNTLHILLNEINRSGIDPALRRTAVAEFLHAIDGHRAEWQATIQQISEELGAVRRAMEQQRARVELEPMKWTKEQRDAGLDKAARRLAVQLDSWRDQEREYSAYVKALSKLLALEPDDFDRHRLTAEDLIPKRAMGDPNSTYDLENYVVGPAAGSLDRVNYPRLLTSLSVRNNVQAAVGSRPVDFLAMRIPGEGIWLYASEDRQALVLSRGSELRYQAIRGLHQEADGSIHYEPAALGPGFPLRMFEDENLAVPPADRAEWLNSWHSESEWFRATSAASGLSECRGRSGGKNCSCSAMIPFEYAVR